MGYAQKGRGSKKKQRLPITAVAPVAKDAIALNPNWKHRSDENTGILILGALTFC